MIYGGLKCLNCDIRIGSLVPAIGRWRVSLAGMKWTPCTMGLFFVVINKGDFFFILF